MSIIFYEDNQAIYKHLSTYVTGHDYAKKVLINLINRSKKRYYQKWGLLEREENLIANTNCLLIGDSGTGKTHLVNSLSKVMDFPLVKIDATELNLVGASGGIKTRDLVKKITNTALEYSESSPNRYRSVEGTIDQVVVFIDEIDKLGQKLSSDWNAQVQASFLTMFENNRELSGVTYIFAGAFSSIDKYGDNSHKSIGFLGGKQNNSDAGQEDLSQKIISAGLMPEFVGRLNNLVLLDKLTKENYRYILENNILPKAEKDLSMYNNMLINLDEQTIDNILNSAMKSGLGVRALQTEVNKLLVDIEFNSI